jgi:surface protein
MFFALQSITNLDLKKFDTSKVTNMSGMLSGLTNLTSLDVSGFNTSNVTNMQRMFASSTSLNTLDLSNFNTSKVTNMSNMFQIMNNLKTIYVNNNWTTARVTSGTDMFYGSTQLVGGAGTTFNSNNTSYVYARIDDPTNGNPGYLTLK